MRWKAMVEGREVDLPLDASIVEVSAGVFSVLLGGRSFLARVDGSVVHVNGRSIQVDLVDPREMSASDSSGASGGRAELTAPMPGKVIRLLFEEGQKIEAGQGILVVEAMKMQNEMQSPRSGTVTSIRVKAGDAVAAGDVLAVVE
jgi:pyruvate carboxylase subunit B